MFEIKCNIDQGRKKLKLKKNSFRRKYSYIRIRLWANTIYVFIDNLQ